MSASVTALLRCGSCSRHFRDREPRCPFCGASRSIAVTRSRPPPLAPGASRARRAATAALVTSSAMVACGGDYISTAKIGDRDGATDLGGAGSGAGGRSGGGAGSAGLVAIAGASATGGVGTGGTLVSGSGGVPVGGAFGMGGAAGGRTCPGATNPAGTLCRNSQECVAAATGGSFGTWTCSTTARSVPCSVVPPRECNGNADCSDGGVCQPIDCGSAVCLPADHCDVTGATPCDPGFVCNPTDPKASARGCAPEHCSSTADCDPGWDCNPSAPGNGCVHRPCTVDTECACGYCVNASCEATLGFCYQFIAMPYGCVWPDEELV